MKWFLMGLAISISAAALEVHVTVIPFGSSVECITVPYDWHPYDVTEDTSPASNLLVHATASPEIIGRKHIQLRVMVAGHDVRTGETIIGAAGNRTVAWKQITANQMCKEG